MVPKKYYTVESQMKEQKHVFKIEIALPQHRLMLTSEASPVLMMTCQRDCSRLSIHVGGGVRGDRRCKDCLTILRNTSRKWRGKDKMGWGASGLKSSVHNQSTGRARNGLATLERLSPVWRLVGALFLAKAAEG